jgi:hypothetical protein
MPGPYSLILWRLGNESADLFVIGIILSSRLETNPVMELKIFTVENARQVPGIKQNRKFTVCALKMFFSAKGLIVHTRKN